MRFKCACWSVVFGKVSNWFINARVRLWKPMVEEMYQQESKEEEEGDHNNLQDHVNLHEQNKSENNINYNNNQHQNGLSSQTPMPPPLPPPATATTTTTTPPPTSRSEFNDPENDPSVLAINTQNFHSENQATAMSYTYTPINIPSTTTTTTGITSTITPSFLATHKVDASRRDDAAEMGSTLIRFGTTGDVSLTLGLRHAGNLPEKSSFSVREFEGC